MSKYPNIIDYEDIESTGYIMVSPGVNKLHNNINNQLNINIRTSLPNNKIDNITINAKTEYITYFNKHTINDIKNKLDKLTNINQKVINNTITQVEKILKKNKQDCIFILFSSTLLSINDIIFVSSDLK